MENTFTWLITGVALGFAALALDKEKQQSARSRLVAGAIGGFLGGWLLSAFEVLKLGGVEGDVVRAGIGAAVILFLARMFD